MRTFKKPSQIEFQIKNGPLKKFPTIRDLRFGATIAFREAPHMVVDVSAYQATWFLEDHQAVKEALAAAKYVLNLGTGRVYVVKDEELDDIAVFIHIKSTVEYL